MNNPQIVPVESNQLSRLKWEYEKDRVKWTDLLCMGTADMDFMSPPPVLDAIRDVVERGHLGYPYITDVYYDIIHNWLKRKTGWEIDAKISVINNVGIYMAAWNAIQILTRPGDGIAILTPVHFCFKKMISTNNRIAIECPLIQVNRRYTIDYQALEACLRCNVKMLWICNPHNPVGRAWTREELKKVSDLCLEYNVFILSDDAYCDLIFHDYCYTPIASLSKKVSYQNYTLFYQQIL